ncbi:hypothetical protein DXA78_19435 [Bacteroides fragilis]|nr:hypothetical protein DXA81_11155 [Bacteroides fragilis]RGP08159.1 hypothetical protein DXA78_19435 [Bacteroides fragilis]
MGNQTIVKYVTQMRGEEGVQKRILSFLFPENVILITFLSDRFRMPCFSLSSSCKCPPLQC